jgi:hypothetical protein
LVSIEKYGNPFNPELLWLVDQTKIKE